MFLIDSYRNPYSGTEKQLFLLIQGLKEYGIEVELGLFQESEYIRNNNFPCPVRLLNINKIFSFRTALYFYRFSKKIKQEGFNLAHIYFIDPSILAPFFLKMVGVKTIVSRRDMGYWYNRFNIVLLRINRFFIDAVVTNCSAVKVNTHNTEHIPNKNIHVIYNGYLASNESKNIVEKDQDYLFFEKKNNIVGLVANIRKIKRLDVLIEAFSIVIKEIPDSLLLILGSGNSSELKQLASNLNIEKNIFFLGSKNNIENWLKLMDVGVLCSDSEGLSNSILEYIQSDLPVVCTNVGGNPELVQDNYGGYLVPPGNYKELAEKIVMLLKNPAKARIFTKNAKNHVNALCDMQTMINKHTSLYQSILSE